MATMGEAFRAERREARPARGLWHLAPLLAAMALGPSGAMAQDAAAEEHAAAPRLSVELNDAAPAEGSGCRLTFLVTNGLGADLAALSLETVVLTVDGRVERLTLFDFRDLPASRPRVRQFDLAGLDCGAVGQVLINGVASCQGDGLDPGACAAALDLSSRLEVELIG